MINNQEGIAKIRKKTSFHDDPYENTTLYHA